MTDDLDLGLDDTDLEDLVPLAGKELKRRFQEDPQSLPGTFVIKLFLDGNKQLSAQDDGHEEDEGPAPNVLDLVQSPGLPDERKRELLTSEREKCVSHLQAIDLALEAL